MNASDPTRLPVIVFCQVSFGVGHWVRTRGLIEGLQARFQITLVLGGRFSERLEIPEGVRVVQIPARVRGPDGTEVPLDPELSLAEVNKARREQLYRLAREVQPAAIVVEYFPFGRYEIEYDVLKLIEGGRTPLIGELRPRALVVCSLRDIRQRQREWAEFLDDFAIESCRSMIDAVLVHSDPALARFEETFSRAAELSVPVTHTGYVVPRRGLAPTGPREARVVVHVGGGQGGAALLRAALRCWPDCPLRADHQLRVITGVFQDPEVSQEVAALAEGQPGVEVLEWVPDLLAELEGAALSVSRCGYNTALDIVRSRVPALVVPYEPPNEDEQRNRAERLQELGLLRCLPAAELSPERLGAELAATLGVEPGASPLKLDGAEVSTRLLAELIETHRAATREA